MVMQFKLIKQRSETNLIAFARDNYSREKVEKSRSDRSAIGDYSRKKVKKWGQNGRFPMGDYSQKANIKRKRKTETFPNLHIPQGIIISTVLNLLSI